MPSRLSVLSIVLFWVATTAFVIRRDVLPRLFASGPPPVSVEVGDEASQLLPPNRPGCFAACRGSCHVCGCRHMRLMLNCYSGS